MCSCSVSYPPAVDCLFELQLKCSCDADELVASAKVAALVHGAELRAICPCLASLSSSVYSRADALRFDDAA